MKRQLDAAVRSVADRGRSRRATACLLLAGALVGLVVALRARPEVMFDDAAITFRYALRLAEGAGFTFNDGDRTNGASAPLYTLLLAAGARSGLRPESGAAMVGVVAYATTVALVGALANRLVGRAAAAISMMLLLTTTVFQNQALSGMESGLSATIGMAVLVALAYARTGLAGVLIGLAIVNRLDAVALAFAAVVVVTSVCRAVPRRMVAFASVAAAPWFVFATWYFGTPIPYSATQKAAGRAGATAFDPTWFVRSVTGREGFVVAALAACVPLLFLLPTLQAELRSSTDPAAALRPRASSQRWAMAAMLTGLGWAALHCLAYSVVDLGAPYPWYTAVVFPVLAAGAGCVVAVLVRRGIGAPMLLRVGVIGVLLLLLLSRAQATEFTARTVLQGEQARFSRELDRTRRDAGRALGADAVEGEVIRTCFGWVAYGAPFNPVDEVCPLSTREPVDDPTWIVESPAPGEVSVVPDGAALHAEFLTPLLDGARGSTTVYLITRR